MTAIVPVSTSASYNASVPTACPAARPPAASLRQNVVNNSKRVTDDVRITSPLAACAWSCGESASATYSFSRHDVSQYAIACSLAAGVVQNLLDRQPR